MSEENKLWDTKNLTLFGIPIVFTENLPELKKEVITLIPLCIRCNYFSNCFK